MNDDIQLADAYVVRRQQAAADDALDYLRGPSRPATPAMPHNTTETAPVEAEGGMLDKAKAVAADVGKGLVETPRALYRGAVGAVNEALDLADAAGQWVESAAGLGGLEIGYDVSPEMLREDGTIKGSGWLGPLPTKDGKTATEISVGVEIDGKETLIPTMVPTLDQSEIDWLLNNDVSNPKAIPSSIMDKAAEHARQQIKEGKSPFKVDGTKKLSIRRLSADELAAKRAAGEDVASRMRLPQVDAPESVTGGIVAGAAQFLTGFAAAGAALKGTKAAAALGQWGTSMAAGAVADATVFDEHQARLSNLIEQYPALKNPVTDYLKADPTDSVAEGRFKNALEGLGLGVLTHGMGLAVSAIRKNIQARGVEADAALKARTPKSLDQVEVEVRTLAPDGTQGTVKMPAKQALGEIDKGITTMKAVLECLG